MAPPARADATETRLPATASPACQAWARAQLGRHQNGSMFTRVLAPATCSASQFAARRSASVPAPRPGNADSPATASGGLVSVSVWGRPARGCVLIRGRMMATRPGRAAGRLPGRSDTTSHVPEPEPLTSSEEQELLAVAHEAAEAGAAELRPRFGARPRDVRTKSTPTDLVSEADLAAEAAIHEVILRRRPGDSILAEEGGATKS